MDNTLEDTAGNVVERRRELVRSGLNLQPDGTLAIEHLTTFEVPPVAGQRAGGEGAGNGLPRPIRSVYKRQ